MPLSETANLVVNMNLKGDFRKGMKGAARDLRGFTTQANQTTGRLTRLQGKLKSPELRQGLLQGVGLSGGLIGFQLLGTAVSGAISYMGDAVTAASDLTEAQSKVDEVFEDSAPTVRRWAATIDDSFGITQRAALKSAGTLGNFLVALGQTEQSAADMAIAVTELAGDLSSFNNVASEDVLVALQAGLAGEAEPVRRLGIDISVARVEALLLAQGIEKVNGEFTQSQKTLGRYLAIMEDTEKAQGDAARTTDSLAGRQRVLDKQLGELQTQIGTALLPVMTELATVATDEVIPAIYQIGESIGPTVELLGGMKEGIDGVIDAVPPELRDFWDDTFGGAGPVLNAVGKGLEAVGDNADHLERFVGEATLIGGIWDDLAQGVEDLAGANDDLAESFATGAQQGSRYNDVTAGIADASMEARPSILGLSKATIEHSDALRRLERAYDAARERQQAFADAADEIAETRSLGKINAELREQRKALRQAAEAGNVRKFAAAQAAIEQLKQEKALRKQGRQALKEYKSNTKEQRQAQNRVSQGITRTTNRLKVLGNTTANPRVTLVGIKAAQAQLTTLRNTLAALRAEAGVTYDPLTGQVRTSAPGRQSGGPVQAGRAYVVGEQRPELFVPNQNGRIMPNVPQGGGDISVYVTPSLVVAAAQVEDQTTKAVRTQRFREKN